MTLYSHKGDIREYEKYSEKYNSVKRTDISDFNDIGREICAAIRNNAFYLDLFEADKILEDAKNVAEICERFKNALKGLSSDPQNFKYSELGKIYGNITQAYTMKFIH